MTELVRTKRLVKGQSRIVIGICQSSPGEFGP